jgi:SPX domain protein involved in polyphosphate accumulation
MKFGEHLRKQRLPQWRFFYLDYDGLKMVLKEGSSLDVEWTNKDDQQFVDRLIIELDKVHSFHALKLGEIQRRIRSCQRRIQTLSNSPHPALSEYLSIQNEITDITCEVQELFWYTRMNYTGFLKIVKKHDRYASHAPRLRENFLMALHNRPFYRSEVFSQLTAELARLYDSARFNNAHAFDTFASMTPPSVITPIARQHQPLVYKTTKYWVHLDNVMDVKTHLLKYMPLISQTGSPTAQSVLNDSTPSSQETETPLSHPVDECHSDETISSVYLDDQHFSSYMARIQFLSEPRTIRLRWYGSDTTDLHVERKAYGYGKSEAVEGLLNSQDEWDESSTKDRHPIKAKWVPGWLNGQWDASKRLSRAYQKQRLNTYDWLCEDQDEEANRIQNVAKDIQDTVLCDQLRPVARTVFRRTVFQSPDECVRVSLDTDLVMAREYGWKDPDNPVSEDWRRNDVTDMTAKEDYYLDIPADPQSANDVYKFPYGIVEVKLRTGQGVSRTDTDEPDCVKNLVRARLMEPVSQFSKYVHAVSVLWESSVPLLPFWV